MVAGAAIALVASGDAPAAAPPPGKIVRISNAVGGGDPDSSVYEPSVSADGRVVAYYSGADDLVGDDTNDSYDAFVTDRVAHTTTRVGRLPGGGQCEADSYVPSLSSDGRWVALQSACALTPADTNHSDDVYLVDLQAQTSILVSKAPSGPANGPSFAPSVSRDGRFVAFGSAATNLVPVDSNGPQSDVFLWDRSTGATTQVSRDRRGRSGNRQSNAMRISADGRFVVFVSYASNLTRDAVPVEQGNVFVWSRSTGRVSWISRARDGEAADDGSFFPAISTRGRFVAYESGASDLVADDPNGTSDVFVTDRRSGSTTLVSHALDGGPADHFGSYQPSISDGGRVVAYWSTATNLTDDEVAGVGDVFTWDRRLDTTTLVSTSARSPHAGGNNVSLEPEVSLDGRLVAFESVATDLGPGGEHPGERAIYLARPVRP